MTSRRRSREGSQGAPLFPAERGEALADARVIAGADEAGFGPMLGPMTIGWSAFRIPAPGADPWRELAEIVTRDPRRDEDRLVVADSKIVFERNPRGEKRLERTALAFLALLDPARRWPASGPELLARMHADVGPEVALEAEPWFPRLPERLPHRADASELAVLVERLDRETSRRGIAIVDLGARVLPVAELNRSFETTGSKGRTHWDKSAPVIRRLWREHARDGLDLVVDRHGGRKRYGALLAETLDDARVTIVLETRARSEYAAVSTGHARSSARGERRSGGCDERRSMRIAFAEKADVGSFPVALASCLAKYAREVCMGAFNAYFGSLQPGLRPTAGYVIDARRWLAEARTAIELSRLPARELVRER